LTYNELATFESANSYGKATEVIDINRIKTVKSDDKKVNSFVRFFDFTQKVETPEGTFLFEAKDFDEKEAWIGAIGKSMIKKSNSNLFMPDEN
jgi:hypothetical protein